MVWSPSSDVLDCLAWTLTSERMAAEVETVLETKETLLFPWRFEV